MSTASLEKDPMPAEAEQPQDDVLEQMLAEAGRLANEMRNLSQRGTGESSTGSFVPDTIQIKDSLTECSSMEAGTAASDMLLGSSQFTTHDADSGSISSHNIKESISEEGTISEESRSVATPQAQRERSSDSNSNAGSPSTKDVEAVIEASEEMVRTLAAMKYTSPAGKDATDDDNESSSTEPNSLSPVPTSPESMCGDSKTTARISHVSKGKKLAGQDNQSFSTEQTKPTTPTSRDDGINWEKVEYTKTNDDDYVPLVDYSKGSPTKLKPRSEDGGIKWEKVSSAEKADDDYAPLADYSTKSVRTPKTMKVANAAFSPGPTPTFAKQHAALRRKRKAQKRTKVFMFLVAFAVVIAAGMWKLNMFESIHSQVSALKSSWFPDPQPEEEVAPGPTAEEIAAAEAQALKVAQEQAAALKAAEEAAARLAAQEQALALQVAEEEKVALKLRQTCSLPMANMLSPLCKQGSGGGWEDRGNLVTQLVQAMLQ